MSVINRYIYLLSEMWTEEIVPLNDLLNNVTTDQLYLLVITIAVTVLTCFFVKLVRGVLKTLARLNSTADSVSHLLEEIKPAVSGLRELEDTINSTLSNTSSHVGKLQEDASSLMEVLTRTAVSYQSLEETLQARLDQELPPILVETKELVSGAKEVTVDIQEKIKATDDLFEAVNEAGQTVKMATGMVSGGLTGLAVQIASMAVGARKSLEYVAQNIHTGKIDTKGGDSNE